MIGKKDYKLFFSLIGWALLPSIYLLIRMNIVALNNVNIDILGQMEWFHLLNEVLATTLIVPLYSKGIHIMELLLLFQCLFIHCLQFL